jgi:hypothetical protein
VRLFGGAAALSLFAGVFLVSLWEVVMNYRFVPVTLLTAVALLLTGCNASPISSFGSAANGREAPPEKVKRLREPMPAESKLSESKVSKPTISLEGEFDNSKALRAMYGSANYNAEQKRALWRPSKAELDRFSFFSDIKTVSSRVLFSKAFQQDETERYFVVTRTAPTKENCEDCVPFLGGAVFTKVGDEWQLDTQNRAITRTGMHGELSGGRAVKIGADKYGVLFHWKAASMGITEEGDLLLAETKNGLKEVFSMVTGGNNKIHCHEKGMYEDDPSCWAYSSKLEFVPAANASYYELKVSMQGTKQVEDNNVIKVRETKRFAYSDNGYRPAR